MVGDRHPTVALLTDFGTDDHFVGMMKAVVANICPEARIIDVSHAVQPQNIAHGAFLLRISSEYFPRGTVFVCVVDPGVGTDRRAVALHADARWYVGPDNGILYPTWASRSPTAADAVLSLENPRYWLDEVSNTFHGRDIFAPVAAHLASGADPSDMGRPIQDLTRLELSQPETLDDGSLKLSVMHIDRFGNLLTNLPVSHPGLDARKVKFSIGDTVVAGLKTNFQSSDGLIAVAGSSGYVEFAAPGGSAADLVGADIGATAIMRSGARS